MDRNEFIEGLKGYLPELTTSERTKIIYDSIGACDPTMKHVVFMEELAELSQQVSKLARGEGDYYSLLEEMADVYIGLDMLRVIYNVNYTELMKAKDIKLRRENMRRERRDENKV